MSVPQMRMSKAQAVNLRMKSMTMKGCRLEGVSKVSISNIKRGDYLLVNVKVASRKKQTKKYICIVQTVYEDGVNVTFLKKLKEPNIFILKQNNCGFAFEDKIEGCKWTYK